MTGTELLPPGAPPEPGKIYESNGLTVSLLAEAAGARVVQHPSVADDFEATRAAVERGLEGDILVVSGGVSVGPHDHVKPAFEACGVDEVFWRVRIKPGKPLWFGRRGSTLVFGLPGNPLSAIVGMALFVVPALRRLRGETDAGPRFERGRLGEPAGPSDGRTTFLISKLVPGRRRRARRLPDRAPGLAHDRRAGRERRLRGRPARLGPAAGGRRAWTCCGCSALGSRAHGTDGRLAARQAHEGSGARHGADRRLQPHDRRPPWRRTAR